MSLKFNQKQMHIVSQLFMAAGKAGHAFDLGRFTKDAVYASDTLAKLSITDDMSKNDNFNSWVQLGLQVMTEVTAVAITAPAPLEPLPKPSPPPVTQVIDDKYVGKLR
jgi:hypothetical protein